MFSVYFTGAMLMTFFMRTLVVLSLPAFFLAFCSPVQSQEDGKVLDKTKSEWLTILQKDEKPRMRKAAVIALGIFGPGQKDILPVLTRSLSTDADEAVRISIVGILGRVEKNDLRDSLPVFADVIKDDKSGTVRAAVARLISQLGDLAKPALMPLIAALKDTEPGVRAAAAEALGKIGPDAKAAVNPLLPLLKDMDSNVRYSAVFAYGRIGPDAAFMAPDLNQVLENDTSVDVRREAARSLGMIGGTSAKYVIPSFLKGLKEDKSEEVRRQIALAIAKMGDIGSVMKELLDIMRTDKDRYVRMHLARSIPSALGSNFRAFVKEYAELLPKETDGEVRLALVQELGALGPAAKEALEILTEATSDPVLQIREAARLAVFRIKTVPKVEPKTEPKK
ncbi:MAG: HEAT repeat domain-containing protein [Planctomycetes bacterium]|nr:HEAT repeat domain-containing protein [Planctomycetota bacterium]